MIDIETLEELQKNQQRFESALRIYMHQGRVHLGRKLNMELAVEKADDLLAALEKPKQV